MDDTLETFEPYNWWVLLLIPIPLVAILGNLLVMGIAKRERSLQTQMNLVSQAFADFFLGVLVMPLALYDLFDSGGLSPRLCDVFLAADVTFSTSSIMSLILMVYDRLRATGPIQNPHRWMSIGLVWLISIVLGLPLAIGINDYPGRANRQCIIESQEYFLFCAAISFWMPATILVILYTGNFKALRNRILRHCPPSPNDMEMALRPTPIVIEPAQQASNPQEDIQPTASCSNENGDSSQTMANIIIPIHPVPAENLDNITVAPKSEEETTETMELARAVPQTTSQERWVTNMLAIVVGIFLFCWVPFFCFISFHALEIKLGYTSTMSPVMYFIFSWLGYLNSALNPLIYALTDWEFRKALIKYWDES